MLICKFLCKLDYVIRIYATKIEDGTEKSVGVCSANHKYFINGRTYLLEILNRHVKRIKTKSRKVGSMGIERKKFIAGKNRGWGAP